MGSSRQEYWSGLPCSPPGDLPDPGMEPTSSESPALAGGFFTTEPPGKPVGGEREGLFLLPWIWADLVEVTFRDFWAEASSSLAASAVLKLWTTHASQTALQRERFHQPRGCSSYSAWRVPHPNEAFMIYSASVQLLDCRVMSKSVLLVFSH